MVRGVPCMCMMMNAAPRSATNDIMPESPRPPVTSLMMAAPASKAARATGAFEVSIEMCAVAPAARNRSMTGIARLSSSSTEIVSAPGRVDSPPTSMICAPSLTIRNPCSTATSGSKNAPPSENESGVTLSTPITMPRCVRSTVSPAIFQSTASMRLQTITGRRLFD